MTALMEDMLIMKVNDQKICSGVGLDRLEMSFDGKKYAKNDSNDS